MTCVIFIALCNSQILKTFFIWCECKMFSCVSTILKRLTRIRKMKFFRWKIELAQSLPCAKMCNFGNFHFLKWVQSNAKFIFATGLHAANFGQIRFFIQWYHYCQFIISRNYILLLAWQNYWMLIGWEAYNYFVNGTTVQLMIFQNK